MTENDSPQPPVLVPKEALSSETLNALIESFILREGTDYGAAEASLETKLTQVRKQLDKEDVVIVFDPNSESVNLLTKREWQRLSSSFSS